MRGEISYEGFRARIASLIGDADPFTWAKAMGISSATFDRMWNGGSIPKIDTLSKIVAGADVSLDWLIYGEETDRKKRT